MIEDLDPGLSSIEPFEARMLIILIVLFEASLAPLAVLLGWLFSEPALGSFAWREEDLVHGVLASLPMLVLYWIGQTWPVGPFRSIKRFIDTEARPILRVCTWPDLLLIAVAAGVGEELLFRGVFQGLLSRWLGTWIGWGVAGLVFGLLHPITLGYVALATVLGTYLSGIYILNGNLLTVIVAHAVYDFLTLWLLLRDEQVEREN